MIQFKPIETTATSAAYKPIVVYRIWLSSGIRFSCFIRYSRLTSTYSTHLFSKFPNFSQSTMAHVKLPKLSKHFS
ncbi:MAG TPA: hypothetical protein DD473_20490 [Planctomycetaceae bacterium]|nr:hypothetical protein [Planctomycetaceae bacterium]